MAEAHKLSQGEGVTVAVIDTGVDPHPDLRENLLPGTDILPGGKGDGRQDGDSHGTSMAGLIAAHGINQQDGALGLAPRARILPIFTMPPEGSGDANILAKGVEWAVSKGADIISISSVNGPTLQLQNAIAKAIDLNIIVVAGVGNKPASFGVGYPAAFDGVLAVAGTDKNGNHAAVSATGSQVVISAPAVDIYTTSYKNKYTKGTGTSNATAIVAGAAALVRSRYPNLPAEEVIHRLTATAVDKGAPGRDEEYGYGVLDLVAALTADVPPLGFESPGATGSAGPSATAVAATPGDDGGNGWRVALIALGALGLAGAVGLLLWLRERRHAVR